MRNTLSAAIVLALGLSLPLGTAFAGEVPATQFPAPAIDFDLPAQSLADSLRTVATESRTSVLFDTSALEGRRAASLKARLTVDEAIGRLLSGSGLTYRRINETTIVLAPQASSSSVVTKNEQASVSSVGRIRWAQADLQDADDREAGIAGRQGEEDRATSIPAESDGSALEEIVVTAQKRVERLQDVPVPVTAINTESLVNNNQLRLQDYYTKVPGLNLTMLGTGNPSISIRGLSTGGYSNPTVGIVIDDLPFGASSAAVNSILAFPPDLDPSELSRVEVLRGPQGTLYGASSLGGLLKFVTVDPSTERVSGRFGMGTSSAHHGDSLGYSARGAVNVPLSETFAVRASSSIRREPGYIDNVQTGEEDTNRTDSASARLAALWRPTDSFTLRLSALYQDTERNGSSEVALLPGLQGLEQSALIDTGTNDQEIQAYSVTMTLRAGPADLTSITGYSRNQLADSDDQSPIYGGLCCAVSGAGQIAERNASRFTQEFRLSIPLAERVEWLLGAFYTDEDYLVTSAISAVDPETGAMAGNLLFGRQRGSYSEYAAFTNLTFQVTDRFDVQIGARGSHNSTTYSDNNGGPLYALFGFPDPVPTPDTESNDDAFTYLLTPRLRIAPDLMVYARLASGYRPGGPNTNVFARSLGAPLDYGHDTTRNYELGAKGSLLNQTFSYDISLYRIDWRDIQLQVFDPSRQNIAYTSNGGAASSKGVELSLELRPFKGLSISAWGAFNDAELTEIPATSVLTAHVGNRLPYSARRSGHLSLDQEFPLPVGGATGFAGATVSYVGARKGRFLIGLPQSDFPAYTQVNLSAGATFESWTLAAFLNNVTDRRGILSGGNDASFSHLVTYIQPRTAGISLSKEF